MANIKRDDKGIAKRKLAGDLKVWEKPVLIQLDIKQTLVCVGSGCGGYGDPSKTDPNQPSQP